MSIASENLMRLASGGYGGGEGFSPYTVHASLLAEGAMGLDTRRYKDEMDIRRQQLAQQIRQIDEQIKQQAFQNKRYLVESGMGSPQELRQFTSGYGLTYNQPRTATGGLSTSKWPGAEGEEGKGLDLSGLLETYKSVSPYAFKINPDAQMNPLYDPNLAQVYKQVGQRLASGRY